MGFFDVLKEMVFKKFWPWFKKEVWPKIQEQMKTDFIAFVMGILKKIRDFLSRQREKREREANEKARAAESKAQQAESKAEAEKHRAVAEVWREVAEQFRRDNEELQSKLTEFENEANAEAEASAENFDIELDFSSDHTILKIGGETQRLPAVAIEDDSPS